jgi:hypothetical protein
MEAVPGNHKGYEWFKAVIALLLLALAGLAWALSSAKIPADEPEQAGGESGALARASETVWQTDQVRSPSPAAPILPTRTLRVLFPTPEQDPTFFPASLPPLPRAGLILKTFPEGIRLAAPDGREVYQLAPDGGEWIPMVPQDLAAVLGAGLLQRGLHGEWYLSGSKGPNRLMWDLPSLSWLELPEITPTASATPAPPVDCPLALPSRLAVGMKAVVVSDLNLRSEPVFEKNLLRIFPAGTVLEVIGGPLCTTYQEGAIVWWAVRQSDSLTGWAAEGAVTGKLYFLAPVP